MNHKYEFGKIKFIYFTLYTLILYNTYCAIKITPTNYLSTILHDVTGSLFSSVDSIIKMELILNDVLNYF